MRKKIKSGPTQIVLIVGHCVLPHEKVLISFMVWFGSVLPTESDLVCRCIVVFQSSVV